MNTRWWRRLLAHLTLCLTACALLVPLTASAQWRCPPGYVRNRWNRCVPAMAQPVGCPPGMVMNRWGRCVGVVVQPRVPPGYFFFRGTCVHR